MHAIGVTGGSGSGKTTLARQLQSSFGDNCKILSQDSYYFDQSQNFKGDGSINFDHPNAIDFDLMAEHLQQLLQGHSIEVPIYDFATHTRKKETVRFDPVDVVIVDGTLILSHEKLRNLLSFSIFIDVPEEVRFSRRLKRDVESRGRTLEGVKTQFNLFVKPMHDLFVEPLKKYASLVISNDLDLNEILKELRPILS